MKSLRWVYTSDNIFELLEKKDKLIYMLRKFKRFGKDVEWVDRLYVSDRCSSGGEFILWIKVYIWEDKVANEGR